MIPKVFSIAPLVEKVSEQAFTYFSKDDLEVGDLAEITFRGKKRPGLVLDVKDIHFKKAELRNASFLTQKATLHKKATLPVRNFFNALNYFSSSALVDPIQLLKILENEAKPLLELFDKIDTGKAKNKFSLNLISKEKLLFSILQKNFNQNIKTVLLCPNKDTSNYFAEKISQEIGTRTKKNKIGSITIGEKEILTQIDGATIVVIVHPDHEDYFRNKLNINSALLAVNIASEQSASTFIYSLAISPLWQKLLTEQKTSAKLTSCPVSLVKINDETQGESKIISQKLLDVIRAIPIDFVFASESNDVSSLLLCKSCGQSVMIGNKKARLSSLKSGKRFLIAGKEKQPVPDYLICNRCKSPVVLTFGTTSKIIFEELTKLLPKEEIILADDGPLIRKFKKEKNKKTKRTIFITKRSLLNIVDIKDKAIVIPSAESLFAYGDIVKYDLVRASIGNLVCSAKKVFIQEKNTDNAWLRDSFKNLPFILNPEELKEREKFGLPPFKRELIEKSVSGKNEKITIFEESKIPYIGKPKDQNLENPNNENFSLDYAKRS